MATQISTPQTATSNVQMILENNYFNVIYLPESKIVMCKCLAATVPLFRFKEYFKIIEEYIVKEKAEVIILDIRLFRSYDHMLMVWYYVHWMVEMKPLGLRAYRFILPVNKGFRVSLDAGRKRIAKNYPKFKFENYDIKYCDTLLEAFES
jgi:hypothetical protein